MRSAKSRRHEGGSWFLSSLEAGPLAVAHSHPAKSTFRPSSNLQRRVAVKIRDLRYRGTPTCTR